MKISVYIIAFNEIDKIQECINSVLWVDEIIVAASEEGENDQLQSVVESLGYRCTRGSENDVLSRFYESAKFSGADVIGVAVVSVSVTGMEVVVDGGTDVWEEAVVFSGSVASGVGCSV